MKQFSLAIIVFVLLSTGMWFGIIGRGNPYGQSRSFLADNAAISLNPGPVRNGTRSVSIAEALATSPQDLGDDESVSILVSKINQDSAGLVNSQNRNGILTADRPPFVQMDTSGGSVFGMPIAQFSNESWLMRNDGAIQRIPRGIILRETITSIPFEPISSDQLVVELRKEFGREFQVRAEHPYVFVTKSKNASHWAERFRNLNASLKQFSRAHGLNLRSLDFPLIAIVMSSEEEFLHYARALQANLPPNCGGFYSQSNNRIVLFEDPNKISKQEVQDTICHEAVHQLAFNIGLHQRCSGTPLWLAEGFATMFEAPAYSTPNSEGRSRWPASRQGAWQVLLENDALLYKMVDSLIRNDNSFNQEPEFAYAVSWGLAHYLSTNRNRDFADFVNQTGKLPALVEFAEEDRWAHFRSTFKMELVQLLRQIKSHIRSL